MTVAKLPNSKAPQPGVLSADGAVPAPGVPGICAAWGHLGAAPLCGGGVFQPVAGEISAHPVQ